MRLSTRGKLMLFIAKHFGEDASCSIMNDIGAWYIEVQTHNLHPTIKDKQDELCELFGQPVEVNSLNVSLSAEGMAILHFYIKLL
jgi:hypothetical protein